MKIVLWCLLLATLFHPGQLTNKSTQSFRIIPIPKRGGYSNFESIVLMSKNDLDSFLTDTSTQIGWSNRQEFEDALLNAKLDFTKEALVLLRHTEGSGSVQVTFETPILQDTRLLCEIRGSIPHGFLGTADMAYYCFAVAVFKSAVSQVELQAIEGGFPERRLAPIVLPIIEKEPANKVLQLPVKQNQIQDCPRISVTCPDASRGGNTPIRFKASVIGGKPSSEVSYNWSVIPVMTLNRRTGSGSDLAGSQHSIANHQLYRPNHRRGRKAPWNVTLKLSDANRPGRYRFLFCG